MEERLLNRLRQVEIKPRRMLLDTGNVHATVPMLRGVWGRALRWLDPDIYSRIFEGRWTNGFRGAEQTPLYLVRPAPADPAFAPAVDWISLGEACRVDDVLTRAWDMASSMGLGPKREPFLIKRVSWLDTEGLPTSRKQHWSLFDAAESMSGAMSGKHPIELRFDSPLRLLRRGNLIESPTFADIALASFRRLCHLSGEDDRDNDDILSKEVVKAATQVPFTTWKGRRSDFVRWSGAQKRELDLRGIVGVLELPEGPDVLWPLLTIGTWVHIGKGTVFGLGQIKTPLRQFQ